MQNRSLETEPKVRGRKNLPGGGGMSRESLGTDSLFFDRFRPLGTLARGKLCKFFLLCTFA
jgi:hypothetical protein